MANRFYSPTEQFADSSGVPYASGQLFFYQTGTSTKLNTYSDAALTIANANPVVLDSAGRSGDIFLQNLKYKVVLAPSGDTDPPSAPIWTKDPVYTSDYSTVAQFSSGSGSPTGVVAGTAGSATTSASVYWDYANSILYVCTTTGTASTAGWTAINSSTAAAVIPFPQGYLTPVSGTPIITADSISATAVYYTPYQGLLVPIYNGASFNPTSIVSELSLTLNSSHTASNIYDFYVFLLSGVPTLGTGPTWSAGTGGNITAGSCVRGTGTSGAAISRLGGLWVNSVSMTMRYGNGTTTTTVAANQATYVGTMYVDGTNGQVTCHRSTGQSRKWGIWNAYNRTPVYLNLSDPTSSWNYSSTWRQSNAAVTNFITVLSGLPEENYGIMFKQMMQGNASGSANNGIGWNSTSSPSGSFGGSNLNSVNNTPSDGVAVYNAAPALGINNINALEQAGGGASTFEGGGRMILSAAYRA